MARKQAPAALAAQSAALASGAALGGASSTRAQLLALAGVDEPEQALLTRLVINKLRNLMSAQSVQRLVVNAGLHQSEVREFVDEDHAIQARAAAELIDLLGLKPSRSAGQTSAGPTQIAITFVDREHNMAHNMARNMAKAKVIQHPIQVKPTQ